MLIQIPGVIDQSQRQVILQALAEARFVDGRLSAGKRAQQVKNNQELDPQANMAAHLHKIIMGNLYNNPTFRNAALPHRVAAPVVAKYEPGMTYGDHIDDPVMGTGERFRCDIAVTVFLNEPTQYDGGELVIRTAFGDQRVKLPAGHAVLYPASSVHYVAEVTRGERIVAVTWVQSMIRDSHKREILYELSQARDTLMSEAPEAASTTQVDHAYVNLVRLWAEV